MRARSETTNFTTFHSHKLEIFRIFTKIFRQEARCGGSVLQFDGSMLRRGGGPSIYRPSARFFWFIRGSLQGATTLPESRLSHRTLPRKDPTPSLGEVRQFSVAPCPPPWEGRKIGSTLIKHKSFLEGSESRGGKVYLSVFSLNELDISAPAVPYQLRTLRDNKSWAKNYGACCVAVGCSETISAVCEMSSGMVAWVLFIRIEMCL